MIKFPKNIFVHLLFISYVFISICFAQTDAPLGTIQFTSKKSQLAISNKKLQNTRLAKTDSAVFAGDRLLTQEDQTVTLQLATQTYLVIAPQSSVLLNAYTGSTKNEVEIELAYGAVRFVTSKTPENTSNIQITNKNGFFTGSATDVVAKYHRTLRNFEVYLLKGTGTLVGDKSLLKKKTKNKTELTDSQTAQIRDKQKIPTNSVPFQTADFRAQHMNILKFKNGKTTE